MNMDWASSGTVRKITAALIIAAVAAPLRPILSGLLGPGTSFLVFTPAVLLAALYGGFLSGFVATALLALAARTPINPPQIPPSPALTTNLSLLAFVAISLFFSWIIGVLHRLRRRTMKAEADAALAVQAAELNETKRRLAAIVESTEDAIVGTNLRGVITSWNRGAEQLYGYASGEALGRPAAMLCGPDCPDKFPDLLRRVTSGQSIKNFETRRRHKNGSDIDVAITLSTIHDEAGVVLGAAAVTRDITAHKRMETARRDMEHIARHDLKTPLNAVINLPLLLMRDSNVTDEQCESLRMIHSAGLRMLEQIDQAFTLYRIETGSYELEPQAVDLPELAREVAGDLGDLARERRVRLTVEAGPEPLAASGDPLLCRTMLANLMKNAVEASPAGGTVLTRILRQGDRAAIVLHNHGAVPRDLREHFFDKYATQGKRRGVGLGTYSARISAEAQHGDIAMASSEPEGTAVTVRLPLWPAPAPSPKKS